MRGVSSISADDVQRLARLARLELTSEEVTAFAQQLGDILEFARQIQSVDTTAAAAAATTPAVTPLREDEPRPSLNRESVLSAAPDHDAATGLIKVPRVLGT